MNAKEEFVNHIKNRIVKCAIVNKFVLKVGYSKKDYNKFLKDINFIYDSGYGGQELEGYIWYNDNTWSERGEYDGSEWWEYKIVQEIPENCK